jgi:TolB-like protein
MTLSARFLRHIIQRRPMAPRGSARAAEPDPVDVDSARRQILRILASRDFLASARLSALLSYLSDKQLVGRSDELKSYAIGVDVFEREETFDPRVDPVVRIEASHLRRALERYYLAEGKADPVVVDVPKGSYVPRFAWAAASGAATDKGDARRWRGLVALGSLGALLCFGAIAVIGWTLTRARPDEPDIPRLLVSPFIDIAHVAGSDNVARGMSEELINEIARFHEITVVDGTSADQASADRARYALSGTVDTRDGKIRMLIQLIRRSDSATAWAGSYEADLKTSKVVEFQRDIAAKVAAAIGQPYGVVYRLDLSEKRNSAPEDWAAYRCTLLYYAYRVQLDPGTHPKVRSCLEAAVARFPTYTTAWALLSLTYLDEIRMRYPPAPDAEGSSLDRVRAAAQRAITLDPEDGRALQAEMLSLYFSGERDAALALGARGVALNPNDMELAGEYGFRLASQGQWKDGCALLRSARDRNPAPPGYFETALGLCAYFLGDLEAAVAAIRRYPLKDNRNYHIVAAAIFAEAGLAQDRDRERDWLVRNTGATLSEIPDELALRYARAEDRGRLLRSLARAGIISGAEANETEAGR